MKPRSPQDESIQGTHSTRLRAVIPWASSLACDRLRDELRVVCESRGSV